MDFDDQLRLFYGHLHNHQLTPVIKVVVGATEEAK